ncbi:MAG: YitT family protein [Clostridia bacterium]
MNAFFKDLAKCTLGALLYAIGISVFLQPNSIAPGGFSGMAVIINHLTNIPTGTLIILLNIPISIIGYKKLGRRFMVITIYAVVVSSIIMNILDNSIAFETEPLIGALYGGVCLGIGLGINFSIGASTGGSDIITKLVRLSYPHLSLGQIVIFTDIFVVALSALVFGTLNSALYATIVIWISSKVIDSVLEGPDLAKLIYIISDKNAEIASEICSTKKRGVTLLKGTGAYTNENKNVIMCAVRRQELPQIKKIASSIDEHSFMIVTDVREVLGQGFKNQL